MPTNEELRRASGQAMQNSRRAIGQSMEDSRRALGQSLIEQRTGKAVAADINRLTNPRVPRKTLRPVEPVGSLPPSRGRGVYKAPPATGGGIASPLIEQPDTREYHSTYWGFYSNDYLIFTRVEPLKSLEFKDASGATVMLEFALPEPE